MAKPTDELPDVSPDEEQKPDAPQSQLESQLDQSQSSDDDMTDSEAKRSDSEETTDSNELIGIEEQGDTEEHDETESAADSAEFLSSDGQDPTAIAMAINQGDGAEKIIGLDGLDQLDDDNLLQQVAGVFLLWWHWAYFEITVVSPNLPTYHPPKIVTPALIPSTNEHEFVYDIVDQGYKLSTSKGSEMYSVGMSMCRMFYTIEKMIFILVKRLKDEGVDTETEVQVSFDGHLLAQRKAFESIINLSYNVVVTNFDPGAWGERYLEIVKRLADRGYGYPAEAPREIYKNKKRATGPKR